MGDRQVRYLSPKCLRPHPQNVRIHPKKQIRQVIESIERFGFTNPILINEHKQVLAGHVRLEAAKIVGLRRVPTIAINGLSEAAQRAYLLADNKLAEKAGWDRAALAVELSELSPLLAEAGLDIELTGFEPPEIDSLLGDLVDREHDPSDEPPVIANEAVSRRGDVWRLGDHRLLCADARDGTALRTLMGRERAAMLLTDPPYNVRVRSIQGRGKIKHREFVAGSGEMSGKQFTRFLADCLGLATKHSVNGSIHFVFMDWRHIREMLDAGEEVYSNSRTSSSGTRPMRPWGVSIGPSMS